MSSIRGVARAAVVFVVLVALAGGARADAQSVTRSVMFDDYGLTEPLFASARAAGMGGAYVSLGNDVHCLMFNPAGLARVKRVELALGLQQERVEIENTFFGTSTVVGRHNGGIEALSIAVPVPTYRGSFVGAFGVYRMYSSHIDLHYRGTNSVNETEDDYFLQQTGSLYSYNLGFGVDLSPTLSGGFALFIVDGTLDVLEQYDYSFENEFPSRSFFVIDDYSVDVDGVGARLGAQFYFHPLVRAGFAFHTPVLLRSNGSSVVERTEHVDNGVGSFSEEAGVVDMEFIVPYRVDVGIASTWRGVTLGVDVGYTDWTEASIDRKRLRARNLEPVFAEVLDYCVGVEWTLSPWPLRLRAGFSHRPYPLKYMLGDRIDGDSFSKASTDDDRHQVSLGAGALVARVMTIDIAYVHVAGSRSLPTLVDDRVARRFLLSASYRF